MATIVQQLKIAIEAAYKAGGILSAKQDFSSLEKSISAVSLESGVLAEKSSRLQSHISKLSKEVIDGKRSFESAELSIEEYRRELGLVDDAADKAAQSTSKISSGLKGAIGAISAASVAFAGFAIAAKQGYEALKEGAALNTAANQFDILTAKINTTSDALLNRMREATQGFVSDANLVASANQIISLGLAKTEEDVAQLATVIGGLGLDMQQVILTFANNSIARLDALGLSVESVKDRAKELEDQGFEGDAFDAAVLQLLTERYNELSGAIDETAAAMMRGEAAWANFVDSIKSGAATFVGESLVAFEKQKQQLNDLRKAQELGLVGAGEDIRALFQALNAGGDTDVIDGVTEKVRAQERDFNQAIDTVTAYYIGIGKIAEATKQIEPPRNVFGELEGDLGLTAEGYEFLARAARDAGQATDDIIITADDMATAEERRKEAVEESTAAIEAEAEAMRQAAAASGDYFTAAVKAGEDALISFAEKTVYAGGRTADQNANLQELQKEYDKTANTIRSLEGGTAGLGLESDKLAEKLDKERERLGQVAAAMGPLKDIQASVVSSSSGFVVNQEAVNSALYASADAAGASASELAILGLATGQFTEAQAEAALKTAALQAKITELGTAIADGLDPQQAISQLNAFTQELENQDFSIELRTSINDTNVGEIGGFSEQEIDIKFGADTTDAEREMSEFFTGIDQDATVTISAVIDESTIPNFDQLARQEAVFDASIGDSGFSVPVITDTTDAELQMADFFATVTSEAPIVPVGADTSAAQEEYRQLRALLQQAITVPVNLEVSGFSGGTSVRDEIIASGVTP